MLCIPQRLCTLCVLVLVIAETSWGLKVLNPPMKTGRVVGGTDAAVNSAAFIVSFKYKGVHYCAGSIINKYWILTAAHCLTSKPQVKATELMAGSIYVSGKGTTTQKRTIDYYVVNDLYTGETSPYDIGLVYTKTAFTFSIAVSAISLPPKGYKSKDNAVLYGWGSTSKTNTATYPSKLQVANVPIIPLDKCILALGAKGIDVHDTNLCTGPLSGGVGICTSDSGGPLIQNVKGKLTLIGVVSWGTFPCGQTNSPSVYVGVASVISWIEKNQVVP